MANPELRAKRRRCSNFGVQRTNPGFDFRTQCFLYAPLCAPCPPCFTQFGFEIDIRETATEREIYNCERSVGDVHGADDVKVLGHVDTLAGRFSVCEFDGFSGTPLRIFQQREHLSEDLSRVAAIDFLNNENERSVWLARRSLNRLHHDPINQRESAIAGRPPPAYEVLVGKRRMKLDYTQSRSGCLSII